MSNTSPHAMSDEDFLNEPLPDDIEQEEVSSEADEPGTEPEIEEESEAVVAEESDEIEDSEPGEDDAEEELEKEQEEEKPEEDQELESETEENTSEAQEESAASAETSSEENLSEEATKEETDKVVEEASKEVNKEVDWSAVGGAFKANGKEMKVSSPEDAIKLMQFGANYTKKMKALQPNLKLVKMLENNGLLDEDKLSFLIDLDKKDPTAVQKFIKDSGVDPLDINPDAEVTYTPNDYSVTDKSVLMDQIVEEIQDTASFDTTYDITVNKWDNASKQAIVNDPTVLRDINNHVEAGIYNQIMEIVNYEQAMGRLTEKSDLEAYKFVGDQLHASGAFLAKEPPQKQVTVQPDKVETKKTDPVAEQARNNARKAAASTKTSSSKAAPQKEYDPLSMSDEDFLKIAGNEFM